MTLPTQHTVNTPYMIGPAHCYTLVADGELVLVDTGPPTPEARQYLEDHLDLGRLRHVLVTHCHIDHYGLTRWLQERCGATVYLPHRDSLKIRHHQRRLTEMREILTGLGFDRKALDRLWRIFTGGSLIPPLPEHFRVAEEELPDRLGIGVVACPGHSQSDLVYIGDGWAITGDTLLRGVFQSPLLDVDLVAGGRFRNYEAYCGSLVRLAGLRGRTILPGHRQQVDSIEAVLLFYVDKLLQRVAQLQPYRDERNVVRLIDRLLAGRLQDVFHLYLKASEVVFMQDLLDDPERLQRALEEIGLFDRVAELFHQAVHRN